MMIPADDPRAPKFWMHESSGRLQPVIGKLLDSDPLDAREMALVAAYLRQWVDSPVWDANPFQNPRNANMLTVLRNTVDGIRTMVDLWDWIELAVREGMGPL